MNKPTMKVLRRGNDVSILHADVATDKLEVGVYSVNYSMDRGFFLTAKEDMSIPAKVYGESSEFTDRVIRTYKAMNRGIGVLLSGPKGTGKTLDAKQICIKSQCPVLTISSAYSGQGFSEFIQSIETACVIFIDEFEKVYPDRDDKGERNHFLTLMDGTAKSRHMYLLTSNQTKIGEYFHSRPGRIRYHKEYQHLSDEMIREIVNDRLKNKDHVPDTLATLFKLSQLSIDSVTAILDECNIHDEGPSKFMDIFNVNSSRPEYWDLILESYKAVARVDLTAEEVSEMEDQEIELSSYRNYSKEEMGDAAKYFNFVPKKFETTYCSNPFIGSTDRPHARVGRVRECDAKSYADAAVRGINWDADSIKTFVENREGITVVHQNGDKITAVPSKSYARTP